MPFSWCCCCANGDRASFTDEPSEHTRLLPDPPVYVPVSGQEFSANAGAGNTESSGAVVQDATARFDEQLLQRMTSDMIDVTATGPPLIDPVDVQQREAEYARQLARLSIPAHLLQPCPLLAQSPLVDVPQPDPLLLSPPPPAERTVLAHHLSSKLYGAAVEPSSVQPRRNLVVTLTSNMDDRNSHS